MIDMAARLSFNLQPSPRAYGLWPGPGQAGAERGRFSRGLAVGKYVWDPQSLQLPPACRNESHPYIEASAPIPFPFGRCTLPHENKSAFLPRKSLSPLYYLAGPENSGPQGRHGNEFNRKPKQPEDESPGKRRGRGSRRSPQQRSSTGARGKVGDCRR